MADLNPIPLNLQLHRAFLEYEREGRIFHLAREKFFSGLPGFDTSVLSNGHRASTPLGPAAGPHTQMMQNIVLCWLAGSRIIELKTVQELDELKIPRPCIDSANVTFNVEWSQELKLQQSLREYVSAAMFLQILKDSNLLGDRYPTACDDTILDMSIGYNLDGIRSPRVTAWIEGMKDATRVIDELRSTLTGRFARYRDLPFPTKISDTITLSTFHGCPPHEIEEIATFLLSEMGLNVCIKMNPTLLGRDEVAYLLFDVLGYREIELSDDAFARDLNFAEALHMLPRIENVARAQGKHFSMKFSNTLVVRNNRNVFRDELMYMSGPALHVLTLNLIKKFREHMGTRFPISFSAGLNAQNVPDMVAMNFIPVTTCTDLLKAGGYGRLHKYMDHLGKAMSSCGAKTIAEFVLLYAGNGTQAIHKTAQLLHKFLQDLGLGNPSSCRTAERWIARDLVPSLKSWMRNPQERLRAECADAVQRLQSGDGFHPDSAFSSFLSAVNNLESTLVSHAGVLNTPELVERATNDQRYRWESNKTSPRKIGTKLELLDCVSCDKCITVCPNTANFSFETEPSSVAYSNYKLNADGSFAETAGGTFVVAKPRQFANFADVCNDCGNCDAACPESGSPNLAKPRFFSTRDLFERGIGNNRFLAESNGTTHVLHAVIAGERYSLSVDNNTDCARFATTGAEFILQPSRNRLISWHTDASTTVLPQYFDLLPYLQMKVMLQGIFDDRHVQYINTNEAQGAIA